jgi:hypothetical protein
MQTANEFFGMVFPGSYPTTSPLSVSKRHAIPKIDGVIHIGAPILCRLWHVLTVARN